MKENNIFPNQIIITLIIIFFLGLGLVYTLNTLSLMDNTQYVMNMKIDNHIKHNHLKNLNFNNLTEEQAIFHIVDNYWYTEGQFNCQYWSKQWYLFAKQYNYSHQYVLTPNHVFNVLYKDNQTCVADQLNFQC